MYPNKFFSTSIFRSTLAVAGMFSVFIILLFGFVYWQTKHYLIARSDAVLTLQAQIFGPAPLEKQVEGIDLILRQDPRMVHYAGLFAADGHRLAGNLERMPTTIQIDGPAQRAVIPVGPGGSQEQTVRGIARKMPSGNVLVIGRNVDEVGQLGTIVGEALGLGLLPALCLSIAAGVLLSVRAQRRVEEVNAKVQRIVAGDLRQRLPIRGGDDAFDRLAVIVNGMLDKIEELIQQMAGVGDDIAHDLRTPLTRVRVGLERGRANAGTLEEAHAVIERAIRGVDQSLSIVTALLRIAEIEHNRRLAGFSKVALDELVREVGDLYEPIAEEKGVTLEIDAHDEVTVRGDRDLLLEAVANLVDNAVKFTPKGGRLQLALVQRGGSSVVRISDTGPGITEDECARVTRRFYRSDRSRQTNGVGLGLSLVAAILKLHDFQFKIGTGPGCVVEITCPHRAAA
ncbi:MAG: HAMP domain-containing protein [Bradyrhizobiaceae bacterium]|nr:HAMP domain-containing protein [Bradyrhizobiaceae bacterium]